MEGVYVRFTSTGDLLKLTDKRGSATSSLLLTILAHQYCNFFTFLVSLIFTSLCAFVHCLIIAEDRASVGTKSTF